MGFALACAWALAGCGPVYEVVISGCDGGLQVSDWVGHPPLTICMSGRGYGPTNTVVAVSFEWDFGDGSSAMGEQVSHTYGTLGEYEVRLTCGFSNGESSHGTALVSVAGEPIARFTATEIQPFSWWGWFGDGSTDEGDESIEMQFDARGSYPEITKGNWASLHQPARLEWNFGDGQMATVTVPADGGSSGFLIFSPPSPMTIRHEYASAGFYDVTLTLTDNLGYTSTITKTITVGTPSDDEENLAENFELGTVFWTLDDEEEEDCIYVEGTVWNHGSVAAGVSLSATAYDAADTPVGAFTYWPAGSTNIGAGVDYAYSFFLCDLAVPGDQVVRVEVVVTDATIYP
jgi:hypothetical protein